MRLLVFLVFSKNNCDSIYFSISACKDSKPILRQVDTATRLELSRMTMVWTLTVMLPRLLLELLTSLLMYWMLFLERRS